MCGSGSLSIEKYLRHKRSIAVPFLFWPLSSLCFTSMVSFTGFYTEDGFYLAVCVYSINAQMTLKSGKLLPDSSLSEKLLADKLLSDSSISQSRSK